jgi:hypothetical protein
MTCTCHQLSCKQLRTASPCRHMHVNQAELGHLLVDPMQTIPKSMCITTMLVPMQSNPHAAILASNVAGCAVLFPTQTCSEEVSHARLNTMTSPKTCESPMQLNACAAPCNCCWLCHAFSTHAVRRSAARASTRCEGWGTMHALMSSCTMTMRVKMHAR